MDRAGVGSVFARFRTPTVQPSALPGVTPEPYSAYRQREYPSGGFAKFATWSAGRRQKLGKNAERRAPRSRNFRQGATGGIATSPVDRPGTEMDGGSRNHCRVWIRLNGPRILRSSSAIPTIPGAWTQDQPWIDLGSMRSTTHPTNCS